MAYDEGLAQRVREILSDQTSVVEKRMFGGLTFMVGGNMCCGVTKEDLVDRVGPERYQETLAEPHARLMEFTGRPLKGMVYVGPERYRSDGALEGWVQRALNFVLTPHAK